MKGTCEKCEYAVSKGCVRYPETIDGRCWEEGGWRHRCGEYRTAYHWTIEKKLEDESIPETSV